MDFSAIQLLILDVDGVLTDGRIVTAEHGESEKHFHVHDGCAIKLWRQAGGKVAIVSGRAGRAVEIRAAELEIAPVVTGARDKLAGYENVLASVKLVDAVTAYVGDDLPDLSPMARCAFPVAVANAQPAVKRAARYVTRRAGGSGAVAEVIELLLRKSGRWSPKLLSNV